MDSYSDNKTPSIVAAQGITWIASRAIRFMSCVSMLFALACAGPSQADIINSLDKDLATVAGPWQGLSTASPDSIIITLQLTEPSPGAVGGTGTSKDAGTDTTSPFAVTGTFAQPALSLVFDGMRRGSHQVRGTFHGRYTTVGGIADTLLLAGVNGDAYVEKVPMLLQKRSP